MRTVEIIAPGWKRSLARVTDLAPRTRRINRLQGTNDARSGESESEYYGLVSSVLSGRVSQGLNLVPAGLTYIQVGD